MNRIKSYYFTSLIIFCFLFPCSILFAQDETPKGLLPDIEYNGSLGERSSLTGDWGGTRNDLSKKGIQFDNSITGFFGSVVDGGVDGPAVSRILEGGDDEWHATWDNVVQLDTTKLGLWQGGLFKFRGEGRVGRSINSASGAISPPNTDALFPLSGFDETIYDLTEATYTQFFSKEIALFGGVLNTLDGDALSLSGSSRGTAQFINSSFVYNPVQTKTIPYKTLGGGLLMMPTGDLSELSIATTVMNTEDSSGYNPFSRDSGTTYSVEVNHGFRLFDKPGKHLIGYTYGDEDYTNLDDPRIVLPGPTGTTKNRSYAAYYSFEQYLSVDSEANGEAKGMGIFGRLGYADGNPNPIDFAYSLGFGGNVPWDSQDTFGVGLYYLDISDSQVLSSLNVHDEKGLELWYNIGITPWLHLTPDIQVIEQGLPGTDRAFVFNLRTHVVL